MIVNQNASLINVNEIERQMDTKIDIQDMIVSLKSIIDTQLNLMFKMNIVEMHF